MRHATACTRCRNSRIRCRRPNEAGAACSACQKCNASCSLSIISHGSQRRIEPALLDETYLLDHGPQVQKFVEDYICFIHDRPHSLFHEPSLRMSVEQGTIPRALLFAICALGSRFSENDSLRALRVRYFDQAKALFHVQMEEMSIASLQTCLLIAQYVGAESQSGIESVYYGSSTIMSGFSTQCKLTAQSGMAHRMAQLVTLNQSRGSSLSNVDRETIKRIQLSIFTADRWHSAGYGVPFLVSDRDIPQEPAVDECIFHSPNFNDLPSIETLDPGLWALRTQLATILGKLQQLLVELADETASIEDLDPKMKSVLQDLHHWHTRLPPKYLLNDDNLELHKSHGKGGSFVDLFLGYNYYCTLLLFHSLGRQPPAATPRHEHAELCRFYALEFASVLRLARSEPGCHAVHYTVGHMTVVSSSALLYFLLSESETAEQKAKIREALLSNFTALEELELYWPTAKRWNERLLTFHKACSEWPLPESFAMNRWMIRFLLQYALPLEAKDTANFGSLRFNDSPTEMAHQQRMTDSLKQLL